MFTVSLRPKPTSRLLAIFEVYCFTRQPEVKRCGPFYFHELTSAETWIFKPSEHYWVNETRHTDRNDGKQNIPLVEGITHGVCYVAPSCAKDGRVLSGVVMGP